MKILIKSILICIVFYTYLNLKANINQDINLDDNNVFDLSINELLNIKVKTSGKEVQEIQNIPASVVVISRKEIEIHGYKTLESILQTIPGLYKVEQYNWSGMSGFGVRGFFAEGSFSHMIIMVNGNIALREGYINQYILARIGIPINAIDRIEVIRGPMSVMYGNGAFFGAINIITNDIDKKNKNNINVDYGSNNFKNVNLSISSFSDEIQLNFNFGIQSCDGIDKAYTTMTSNPIVTMPDGSKITYLESVGLKNNSSTKNQLSTDSKFFGLSGKFKNFTFDLGISNASKGLLWNAPTPDPAGQNVLINAANAFFQYEQDITDELTLNSILSYNSFNSNSRYNILATKGTGNSHINSSNIFYELNGNYKPHHDVNLTFGVTWETVLNASNDVDIPSFGVGNSSWRIKLGDEINDHAIYTQFSWKILSNLEFICGLRANMFGDYTYQRLIDDGLPTKKVLENVFHDEKIHLSERYASIYKINESNILKIMVGTAIMSPNLRQNVTRLDLNGTTRSQLEPSSIKTFEISYDAIINNICFISLSVFQNNLDKLIESSGSLDDKGNYIVVTQNSGKIKTQGIEITFKSRPIFDLEFQFSLTYQNSKNEKPGWENIAPGYSPNLLGYINLAYKIKENISISFNGNYVDKMETSWLQQNINPEIGRRYGKSVPGYFSLNTTLNIKKLFNSNFNFNFSVNNITDKTILYATDPSNQWADKGFIDQGRTFIIGIGYDF